MWNLYVKFDVYLSSAEYFMALIVVDRWKDGCIIFLGIQ